MANLSAFNNIRKTTFDVPKDIQENQGTFAKTAKHVLSQEDPNQVSVKEVWDSFVSIVKQGPQVIAETFAPAITEFFKTTGGVLGEGLAYAVDKNVRTQFEAGNLDILPIVTNTTQADIAKKTIAAGIETAVYRNIPTAIRGNLAQRGGIGALQGVGFAVAEGLALDRTPEEIIDSAKVLGPAGAVINIIAPYLTPILKAEMKLIPTEVKRTLQGLKFEAKGVPLKTVEANAKALRQVEELFPAKVKQAKAVAPIAERKIVADTPELQKFVDEKAKILRQTDEVARVADEGRIKVAEIPKKEVPAVKETVEVIPLVEEAKKFKTADEFVEAQGETLFRGGSAEGSSFSSSKGIADDFAKNRGGSVTEHIISPSAKIVEYSDVPNVKHKNITDDILNARKDNLEFAEGALEVEFSKATKWAKENGFDAIKLPIEGEVRIINPEVIKTRSQLTEAFNKAKTKVEPTPKFEAKEGVSKHFERIKHDLEAAHDSVEFDKINLKDQAEQAFKLIEESPNDALRVAYGMKNPPGDLTKATVQIALVESLKVAGKLDQARALARRFSLELTKSAQQLNVGKLDIGSAGVRRIESIIMEARLKKIGNKIPETIKNESSVKRAHRKIASEAGVASQEVQKSAKTIYKTADDLLDALTC